MGGFDFALAFVTWLCNCLMLDQVSETFFKQACASCMDISCSIKSLNDQGERLAASPNWRQGFTCLMLW